VQTSVAANNSKDVDMQQVTQDAPERATAKSAPAAKRRRSLRIADSALVTTLIASYATSGGAVAIHATVSLVFTAAVGWHFWLHRKWFKSVKKRLAKTRTTRSRRSATINVLIFGELTLAIVLGIVAWLGPRSLSGPHAVLANIMVGIAIVHIALNARQLKALIRRRSINIDRRFRGSPVAAQGGYAAGKAASFLEGTVEVQFNGPTPLDQDLSVEVDDEERVTVLDGSDVVMEVSPDASVLVEIPADNELIDAIFSRGPVETSGDHERPHCFGCSLDRHDGLGIATLPIGATGIWGTTWTPGASLPSTGDFVDDEIVWAALDCPGSFAASDPSGRLEGVTGFPSLKAMTVEIREKVRIGEQLAVLGWRVNQTGSVVDCGVAIVDRDHRVKAYAHLTHVIADDHQAHGQ
jgi:hypothetical protein